MNRSQRRLATPHLGRQTMDNPRFGPGLNAHWQVAKVAIEMANAHFETYMRVNALHHKIRANGKVPEKQARKVFVDRVAPRLLEEARLALTNMLTQPDDRVPVAMKDEIAEALILDSDLRGKRIVAEERLTIEMQRAVLPRHR